MKLTKRMTVGVAGLTVAAASTGMLLLGAGAAHAAAPPYEPDASSVGTITFYNAAGTVITSGPSGDTGAPFAAYAVGSGVPRAGDPQAQIIYANPNPDATPFNWYKESAGLYTQLPLTTGPANIQTLSQTRPVVANSSDDQTLDGFRDDSVHYTGTGYTNTVQVRIRTATRAGSPSTTYDVADLVVDPDTHTWTQVYPAVKTATSTTLGVAPSPATAGDTVTLTATETPATAGSVQFADGTTNIGSPVTVDPTGKASTTTSTLAQGSHNLSAVFTPTDTTFAASTGTATEVVNAASTPTRTALAVSQTGTAGDPATLTASVTGPGTTANDAGTVSFFDGTSTTPLNPTPATGTNGTYTFSLPNGFTAGTHSIIAKFTPSDLAAFQASQSSAQTFVTQAPATGACAQNGSSCVDPQGVVVTVPSGTLTITTPYTAANPLDLGTMTLDANSTQFSASGNFNDIKVTDTRSGSNPYTVSALSTPLSDGKSNAGSTISAQNVGLTNLVATPGTGFAGTVTPTDNPAATPAVAPGATGSQGLGGNTAHTVFTTTNGLGSVTVNGKLTITAPTSTEAGLFTGTITFTVG